MYADPSDASLNIVLWVAYALFGASLLCLVGSLALRKLRNNKEKKLAALEVVWRPILYSIVAGETPTILPVLHKRDIPAFSTIWLKMHQRLRGDSAQALLDLLVSLNVTAHLPKMLNARNTDNKLIALLLMTALKDTRALTQAKNLFDHSYELLSFTAAKMYMVIAPEVAVPMVLARVNNANWPRHKINSLLNNLSDKVPLVNFLRSAVEAAPAQQIPELLRVTFSQSEQSFGAISRLALARFPEDEQVITTVLELTNSNNFLPLADSACRHKNPVVRRAGVKALNKLSIDYELPILEQTLQDQDWQVQHYSALALVENPKMTQDKAQALLKNLPDGSAKAHLLEALYHRHWLLPENWQPQEAV